MLTSTKFKIGDEVHITNNRLPNAMTVVVYEHNGKAVVNVPNILLQTTHPILAYRYVDDGKSGYTVEKYEFTVNQKPKPDDYVYTETELWTAERAVENALREAKESGEFDGKDGEKGEKGDKGDPGVVKYKVVNELPIDDTENAIYLVPVTDGAEDNLFDEYIFVDGVWEKVGGTSVAVDLTDYVKNTDYPDSTIKAGVVKVDSSNFGIGAYPTSGILYITPAEKAQIDAKTHVRRPIVPCYLDYAVKKGLTDNKEEWTEEEKASARALVGAVGSTDYATDKKAGLVRIHGAYGLQLYGDLLVTVSAENNQIDAKSHGYHVITPKNLDYAVKSAITTNTITLTDEEKAAVRAWLGID